MAEAGIRFRASTTSRKALLVAFAKDKTGPSTHCSCCYCFCFSSSALAYYASRCYHASQMRACTSNTLASGSSSNYSYYCQAYWSNSCRISSGASAKLLAQFQAAQCANPPPPIAASAYLPNPT